MTPSTSHLDESTDATGAAPRSPRAHRAVRTRHAAHPTPARRSTVESIRHDVVVPLGRIAWITTVAVFVIAAICLFLSDYTGYAVLSLAVAASAAINLR